MNFYDIVPVYLTIFFLTKDSIFIQMEAIFIWQHSPSMEPQLALWFAENSFRGVLDAIHDRVTSLRFQQLRICHSKAFLNVSQTLIRKFIVIKLVRMIPKTSNMSTLTTV